MKSPQTLLVALFALTTLGGGVLAWQQYGELVELRASAMNRDERADMQKRVWDLEKNLRELQDQLAAARARPSDGADALLAAATDGEPPSGEREGRGGRGDPRGGRGGNPMQQALAVRDLMSKPEVQAMLSLQQKAAVEARYGALFRTLNLTPEQTDKLKGLLADRSNTRMDVMSAAQEQGIDSRSNPEEVRKLFTAAQNELNNSIKAVVGENGFAQLQNYEQTLPQRGLVNDLQQRLSFSDTPLSASQADSLVQILASNAAPRPTSSRSSPSPAPGSGSDAPGGRGSDFGGFGGPSMSAMVGMVEGMTRGGGSGVTVTAGAVAQAQSVLAPSQLAALQQIQQQQQAQQQLQQLVRETLSANQPAPAATGSTSPGGSPPPRKRGGE